MTMNSRTIRVILALCAAHVLAMTSACYDIDVIVPMPPDAAKPEPDAAPVDAAPGPDAEPAPDAAPQAGPCRMDLYAGAIVSDFVPVYGSPHSIMIRGMLVHAQGLFIQPGRGWIVNTPGDYDDGSVGRGEDITFRWDGSNYFGPAGAHVAYTLTEALDNDLDGQYGRHKVTIAGVDTDGNEQSISVTVTGGAGRYVVADLLREAGVDDVYFTTIKSLFLRPEQSEILPNHPSMDSFRIGRMEWDAPPSGPGACTPCDCDYLP